MEDIEVLKATNHKIATNVQTFVSNLLNEADLNKRSKIFINAKCDEIKIVPIEFDLHFLILKLDDRQNASVLAHSLPETEQYFKPIGTIETHSAMFYSHLQGMERFYVQMDTIDQLTCVVDPPQVTTKHDYRIIRLESRVYMKIKVDPKEPSSVITTFYGPTKLADKYRALYSEKMDNWNTDDDILANFLKIFGFMSFPQQNQFDSMMEYCSICYTYRVGNQIPIVSCDNEKCSMIFHTMCLKEWFSSLRDTKTFLNMTSGRCPACKEKLSTAFNNLLEQ